MTTKIKDKAKAIKQARNALAGSKRESHGAPALLQKRSAYSLRLQAAIRMNDSHPIRLQDAAAVNPETFLNDIRDEQEPS